MAPELRAVHNDRVKKGSKSYNGPPLDVWAAGCVLFFLLTGKHLFDNEEGSTNLVTMGTRVKKDITDPAAKVIQWIGTHGVIPLLTLMTCFGAQALLLGMLDRNPKKRWTMQQVTWPGPATHPSSPFSFRLRRSRAISFI